MRSWLPLSLIALLLAGLAVFLSSESPDEIEAQNSIENPAGEGNDPATVIEAATRMEPTADDIVQEPVRTDLSVANPRSELIYATPAEEGVVVAVVDGNTMEALAHAEVMVIDTGVADMRALEAEMSMSPDFEKLFERLGVVYKTDQSGKVRIPFAVDSHILAGRTPTHFNLSIDVEESSEEVTLYLNPTENLQVKIVDWQGNPVKGAPVSLRVRKEHSSQDFTTSYSNEEGIASLRLFQLLVAQLAKDETYAALLYLSDEPVEVKVDLQNLPETPPVLVMPDAGQVHVEVLDSQGQPVEQAFLVNVDLLLPEDTYDNGDDYDAWNYQREHLTGRTSQGKASFPLVDYNQRIHITAVSPNGELRADVFGEGPVPHGGPALFTLTPQAERPVVVGRILNTEGAIGPNLNLEYVLKMPSKNSNQSSRSGTLKTDADGQFRLLMEDLFEEGAERTLTISMKATRRKPKRSVAMDLSYFLAPGANDLGDLVLVVPPLVASGSVVDAKGDPLSNAQVRLEQKKFYGEEEDQFWWNGIWEHRTQSNRDGQFEIRANLDPDSYRLSASLDHYLESSLEFVQGTEDLKLVMEKSVTLKGRFLLDDEIDLSTVRIVVKIPDPHGDGYADLLPPRLGKDGSFIVEDLPRGSAILTLRSNALQEELYAHPELTLSNQDDVQILDDIDLRGMFNSVRIWVRNPQGELIPKIQIWTQINISQHEFKENPFVITTQKSGLDFQITAHDYRAMNLQQVTGEREVVLQNGFPIQLDISNLHALPEDWELRAFLKPLDAQDMSGGRSRLNSFITEFGPNAEPVPLKVLGNYSVRFLISSEGPDQKRRRLWLDMKNPNMDVADLPSVQVFRYTLDEEAISKALAED